VGAVGADQLRAERGDYVLAGERGRLRRQPLGAGELLEDLANVRVRSGVADRSDLGRAAKDVAQQRRDIDVVLGSFGAPPLGQGSGRLVLLGLPGRVHHPLDQLRRADPTVRLQAFDLGIDRVGALGEHPHQLLGDARELAVAVGVRSGPRHLKRPRQRPLVGAPVDRVGRQPMAVQVATIKRRPATIRPLHPVGHDHVGVQQRVARPRRAVVKPDRDQPPTRDVVAAAMAASGADMFFQVAERLGGRLLVRGQHLGGDVGVAQAVQQRHALGRAEDHVEGGHAAVAVRAAEQLAGVGVAAVEDAHERLGGGGAVLAERGGALAEPAAGGLAVAGEVLLAVVGDLAEVVVLAADRQLGDVHDHPRNPPVLALEAVDT
jgi:hypothetical protein